MVNPGIYEVMAISLTLVEAKLLLARVQRQFVAEQANTHAM